MLSGNPEGGLNLSFEPAQFVVCVRKTGDPVGTRRALKEGAFRDLKPLLNGVVNNPIRGCDHAWSLIP